MFPSKKQHQSSFSHNKAHKAHKEKPNKKSLNYSLARFLFCAFCAFLWLEGKPSLHLERSRRIDVRERRDRIRRRPHSTHELSERWHRNLPRSEHRYTTPEEVSVIEKIESFQSQQDRLAFRKAEALLHERRHRSEE